MALSGTLDTFELPDVLRLLASTAKTGRLRITGDRGSGSVWVANGEIVWTELLDGVGDDVTDEEAVFGMLRFATGSFTFEADASAPSDADPRPIAPVLGAAEALLVEWRSIEAVVPSLDVWVLLCPELRTADVMIGADRWRAIAAIGSGTTVGAVGEALEQREMDACRTVKELIELGLVEIGEPPTHAPFVAEAEVVADAEMIVETEAPLEEAPAEDLVAEFGDVAVETPAGETADVAEAVELAADRESAEFAADTEAAPALAALESSDETAHAEADPLLPASDPLDAIAETPAENDGLFAAPTDEEAEAAELDPAEMARQLANLSPKAAKAVAAAAKASTAAERDAALAAVEAEDDSVNRGLLLKFLGSVES